jgi:hypothetical protein
MLPALSGARRIAKTEFIAWAAANTDKANYCSIGCGSPSHLAAEMRKWAKVIKDGNIKPD